MQTQRPFWYLFNLYGWLVFGMSLVTALIIGQWWVMLLGFIGYLIAVLVDLIGGGSLGRTGAVRLARAEQENRELRAEQARLLGGLRERDAKLAALSAPQTPAPAPANPPSSSSQPSS
jgi:hypothetical protein